MISKILIDPAALVQYISQPYGRGRKVSANNGKDGPIQLLCKHSKWELVLIPIPQAHRYLTY
jgi:hypothetical protein